MSDKLLKDHKEKLIRAKEEEAQPEEVMTEVLLSLRVNALQVPIDQRPNLVSQLVSADIFDISSKKSQAFLLSLFQLSSHGLKHALTALISIVVSTPQGIQYIT